MEKILNILRRRIQTCYGEEYKLFTKKSPNLFWRIVQNCFEVESKLVTTLFSSWVQTFFEAASKLFIRSIVQTCFEAESKPEVGFCPVSYVNIW